MDKIHHLLARRDATEPTASLVVEADLFDAHKLPHENATLAQFTLFLVWIGASAFYIFRCRKKRENTTEQSSPKTSDPEKGTTQNADPVESTKANGAPTTVESSTKSTSGADAANPPATGPVIPTLDKFLQYVFIFGLIMVYIYLCEYKKIIPILDKEYSRDIFLFLVFMLFLVGCTFTIKPTAPVIIGRDQTEEWKGWMQVMFVWYHYFSAGEWYNWIRIYIACYVWMTGFGNFSFFWVKKDFSIWRMLKMLFRLNFLVTFVCLVTKNEYILYYICAMHTYWFITVYLFMRILSSWNEHRIKMVAKFAAYVVCNALLFEIPNGVATVFRPLWFIFQYHDGKRDIMHEWQFRLGLDHWVCLVGMLCAYNYPHFEAFLKYIEDTSGTVREQHTKIGLRLAMIATAIVTLFIWYFSIMRQDKYAYNHIHPYTSFIPILAYIVLRNSFPILRKYHIHMFAWLGKITLETYLCQLHIYLQSNAKDLLMYIPDSRLLNFSLSTIIYIAASYMLFKVTNIFSSYLIPKDMKLVARYISIGVAVFATSGGMAAIVQYSSFLV